MVKGKRPSEPTKRPAKRAKATPLDLRKNGDIRMELLDTIAVASNKAATGWDLMIVEAYNEKTNMISGRLYKRNGKGKNYSQTQTVHSLTPDNVVFNIVTMEKNPNGSFAIVGEPRLEYDPIPLAIEPAPAALPVTQDNPEQIQVDIDQVQPAAGPPPLEELSDQSLPNPKYIRYSAPNPDLVKIGKAHHCNEVFGLAPEEKVTVKNLREQHKKLRDLVEQLRLEDIEEARREETKAKLETAFQILKRRFGNQKPVLLEDGVEANAQGEFEMNSQNMRFDSEAFCCEAGDCPTFIEGDTPTVQCSSCETWFHFQCMKINDQAKLDLLQQPDNPFICRHCVELKPKQGGAFELFDEEEIEDNAKAKYLQHRISDCQMKEGVVQFKLHWFDTEDEVEAPLADWFPFGKVKYSLLEEYYGIHSADVEKFDEDHNEVVPATPKEIIACKVTFHKSAPNKRIPLYRVDWANQSKEVEDWRPTWDLNWTMIADYHQNKEGVSETEIE